MAKYKLKNFLKESHPSNDQWLEAFKDALGFETLISPSYLIGKYGHLRPEEAAQLFMNDSTATQMAHDEETYRKETGLEEDEFKFRPTETDAPGMQARPDGYLKDKVKEHHNDPNFPGGPKIHALLDKVAEDWGKDSDLYSDLEDKIVGWSNRQGELSPKGILAIKALLSNWDSLEDYQEFLPEEKKEVEESLDYQHMMKVRAGIIK